MNKVKNNLLLSLGCAGLILSSQSLIASEAAHHIKDAPDCKEVIQHHCKGMDEASTEKCLVDWHEHHAKEAADELKNHQTCVKLILELEKEAH